MPTDRWAALEAALAKQVKGERLRHIYRVLETARVLAPRFGVDLVQAEEAALMHDYAKHLPPARLSEEARRRGLIVDPAEEVQPQLLHGPVAAALLEEEGLISDPAVLDAIRWHTTGRPGMSLLEKVIWVADYIEPGRSFDGAASVRAAAEQDIDAALRLALAQTIQFVLQQGRLVHLFSVHTWNWLVGSPKLFR